MDRFIVALIFFLSSSITLAQRDNAVFAGGCFWCMEADFDHVPGVITTTSGFDGGTKKNPTYNMVSSGITDYAESVLVVFDTKKVSYKQLVDYFFRHIDPTTKDAQFCDHGRQYRSAIFYLNEAQKKTALAAIKKVKQKLPEVFTEIVPSTHFYPAEEYHQDYYKKNPIRYGYYRRGCGRDARVEALWGTSGK